MTNKEAIKWLNEAEILDLTRGNTKDRQAINAAISALKAMDEDLVRRQDTLNCFHCWIANTGCLTIGCSVKYGKAKTLMIIRKMKLDAPIVI